jgi:hypothetical protein
MTRLINHLQVYFFRALIEKGGVVGTGIQIKSLELLEKLFPCSKQAGWEQPVILYMVIS